MANDTTDDPIAVPSNAASPHEREPLTVAHQPGEAHALNRPSREKRHNLTRTQREQCARLLVAGVPRTMVAAAMGVSEQRLADLDNHDADMATLKEQAAAKVVESLATGYYKFASECRTAVDILVGPDGLRHADAAVRNSTARYVVNKVFPREGLLPGQPRQQLHQHELSDTLTAAIVGIAKTVEALRPVLADRRPIDSLVRRSFSELPTTADLPQGNGADPNDSDGDGPPALG